MFLENTGTAAEANATEGASGNDDNVDDEPSSCADSGYLPTEPEDRQFKCIGHVFTWPDEHGNSRVTARYQTMSGTADSLENDLRCHVHPNGRRARLCVRRHRAIDKDTLMRHGTGGQVMYARQHSKVIAYNQKVKESKKNSAEVIWDSFDFDLDGQVCERQLCKIDSASGITYKKHHTYAEIEVDFLVEKDNFSVGVGGAGIDLSNLTLE